MYKRQGEECPIGVSGEFVARGYNIMKGYYKMPAATAATIDADGWLHTGDLARRDADGNYKITGRIKDMIIRGGENVYPREIEEYLMGMPGVLDVQVVAVPSFKYGEEVAAFIIPRPGVEIGPEDVRAFCRGKIAWFKIPKYVAVISGFPLTASGKIQKYKLRSFYAIFLLCVCFFFFYLEAPGTVLMTRAGTPPTTVYAGTSFVTTAPAASTA